MNLYSYEEFDSFINGDIKHRDIRIYRFINIESLSLWVKVKNLLAIKCTNQIRLSIFCSGEDLTPKINRLCAKLESIDDNTLLLPLSEHLRINNTKCDEILRQIISVQYINDISSTSVHVYIPMYRMKDHLKLLLANDYRLNDNIIFLETEDKDDDYSLTIISRDIDVDIKGHTVNGYKNYLEYWEDNPAKPIIFYTDNARFYKNNVFSDNVNVLVNAFDIIKFHKLFPYSLEEKFGEDWQWRELLLKIKIKSKPDINTISEKLFGTNHLNATQLLSKWKECGEFEKWLIWLWLKFEAKTSYLSMVMHKSENYVDLLQNIVCVIFNYPVKDSKFREVYLERKKLIETLQLDELMPQFWTELEKFKDIDKYFFLTSCTKREREQIIALIGKISINTRLKGYLEYAYPSLYAYVGEYAFNDALFTEYFNQYKIQKIQNAFTDEFIKKVSDLAAQKGVWWKLTPRNKYVAEAYNENSFIYWVDALGVEYLSLIQTFLENKYKGVHYIIEVGYADIPTVTEFNKDFVVGRNHEINRELDDLKHNGDYPVCIETELQLVEQVFKIAVQKLDIYDRVIIASDHGSSRGAILCKGISKKADENAKVERFGRYCMQTNAQYEDRYTGCISKENYHVFASYDRFSVGGNEKSEIHGGATLEEVLVPIIILSKTPLEEKVVIIPLEIEIRLKAGLLPKVKFKIDKPYKELYATVDAKKYICYKESDYWYFEPDIGKKDHYVVKISSKGNLGEFNYGFIKGRVDSDKFNI
jgi:hypothetical protein